MDQDEDMKARLKASELLGKSQADFIERKLLGVDQDMVRTLRDVLHEIDGQTAGVTR